MGISLKLDAQIQLRGTIPVSPDSARQCANGYLGMNVGMAMQASDPVLVWGKQPIWRLQVHLYLRGYGKVANLGSIHVNATTRQVIPLSDAEITTMQDQANAIAHRLTSAATSTHYIF